MPSFRYAATQRGDTMRRISLRELGTAELWVELALLNSLRPPYIVDESANAGPGVLLAGEPIRIPASGSYASVADSPAEVFGVDALLVKGKLQGSGGDLELVSGEANFLQAIRHRLKVIKRELGYHPDYGNFAPRLIGRGNGPAVGSLAAFYVRSAIREDPRVAEVPRCVATMEGEVLRVDADIVPITGKLINLSMDI